MKGWQVAVSVEGRALHLLWRPGMITSATPSDKHNVREMAAQARQPRTRLWTDLHPVVRLLGESIFATCIVEPHHGSCAPCKWQTKTQPKRHCLLKAIHSQSTTVNSKERLGNSSKCRFMPSCLRHTSQPACHASAQFSSVTNGSGTEDVFLQIWIASENTIVWQGNI